MISPGGVDTVTAASSSISNVARSSTYCPTGSVRPYWPGFIITHRSRSSAVIACRAMVLPPPKRHLRRGRWPIAGICSKTRQQLSWRLSVPKCQVCAERLRTAARSIGEPDPCRTPSVGRRRGARGAQPAHRGPQRAGVPIKAVARITGVSRQTIRKVLRGQRHDTFRCRQSSLNAWSLTLEAEWAAGCQVGAELWRRLKVCGFAGSLREVSEWATRRRRDEKLGHTGGASLSARAIARSMTTERETDSARTAMINAVVEQAVPTLIAAREALERFHAMMRSKDETRLYSWIAVAVRTNARCVRCRRRCRQGCRGCSHLDAMVKRPSRGHHLPPQIHQAPDVRPRQTRSTESKDRDASISHLHGI